MTLTDEQLDKLCGSTPKIRLHCAFCGRTVGPYYYIGDAKAALTTHIQWVHFSEQLTSFAPRDEKAPKNPRRARLHFIS